MTKQASAVVFAAGEAPQLWVDGTKNVLTVPPGPPAGVTNTTGPLEWGRGGRGSMGYFKGRCSFLGLSSRRQPTEVLESVTAALADPRLVYGVSAVNRITDTIKGPCALPVTGVTAPAGVASAAVNVGALSYDPGGLALTCTAASIATGNALVTRSGGTLTITPTAGLATGTPFIADFTIANSSGKASSNRVYGAVVVDPGGGPVDPPPGGVDPPSGIPKLQPAAVIDNVANWRTVGFAQTGTKSTHNSGNLRTDLVAAVGAASAGDVVVLADGTYTGTAVTIANSGTKTTDGSKHIMVRARTHGKATIALPLAVTGKYVWITGCVFTYWSGTNFNGTFPITGHADGLWVTNCKCTAAAFLRIMPNSVFGYRICYNSLFCDAPAANTDMGIIACMENGQTDWAPRDTDIAWNRATCPTKPNKRSDDTIGSRNFWMMHPNHCTTQNALNFCSQDCRIHHNHCVGSWTEIIYSKRNVCFEYNYCQWVNSWPSANDFTFRHGLLSTSPQYNVGGICRGNLFDSPNQLTMELNGVGIVAVCNKKTGAAGDIRIFAGSDKPNGTIPHDSTSFTQLVDNVGFSSVTVGYVYSNESLNTFRGGNASNIRIYKGDRGWNPSITHPHGSSVSGSPFAGYGTGLAAQVTTITEADLLNAPVPVGWDAP